MLTLLAKSLQVNYTLGENVSKNPDHIPIVRAQLTRALPELVPEVIDEIQEAFVEVIPPTEGEHDDRFCSSVVLNMSVDWTSVKVLENSMKIVSRASNRIFVGLPLCMPLARYCHDIFAEHGSKAEILTTSNSISNLPSMLFRLELFYGLRPCFFARAL